MNDMEYRFELTDIIKEGDWEDIELPFICEAPLIVDGIFFNFRIALRVSFINEVFDELGYGRDYEGDASQEIYSINFVSNNKLKLREILQQVRTILIEYAKINVSSTRTYNSIVFGQAKLVLRLTKWVASLPVYCYKKGKVRG